MLPTPANARVAASQAAPDVNVQLLVVDNGSDDGTRAELDRLADLIDEHAAELAAIESFDNGKPIAFSSTVDLPLSAMWVRYMAGWPTKLTGRSIAPALQRAAKAWGRKFRRDRRGLRAAHDFDPLSPFYAGNPAQPDDWLAAIGRAQAGGDGVATRAAISRNDMPGRVGG